MTVHDYGKLASTETRFGQVDFPASVAAKEWLAGLQPSLATPMWAVRDAPWAAGQFPVVIYAPGFSGVSWENADLCEYLASHGYVVLATPSMGATSRSMTYDLEGVEAQARDISFLIAFAHSLTAADVAKIGVIGFSWGGISNIVAAARDNRITALVALDGSLRYSPGLLSQAGDVHPEQMCLPLLSIAQGQWTLEDHERFTTGAERQGPNVLNAWTHGDLIAVYMLGMAHGEFGSMYQRNEDSWRTIFQGWHQHRGDYSRQDSVVGYGWMARYTLEFLDAYLKQAATAAAFLANTPAGNGVPAHMMAAQFRAAATPNPASLEGFRLEIGRRGFDRAAEIYQEFRGRLAHFELSEHALGAWSDELIETHHVAEARRLLELNVQIHPGSSDALVRLGDLYQKTNRRQPAIDAFRAALEKDPNNPARADITRKIEVLEGRSTATHVA
jgi:dienelactone hydrolase